MRPGGGKNKGSQFERDLCRKLSLWITKGLMDDTIWRSASSGAVATIRKKKASVTGNYDSQIGDLSSISPESQPFFLKYAVEAKRYKDLQFDNLICGANSKAKSFWQVHVELCLRSNKQPVCIMQQNRKVALIFITQELGDELRRKVKGVFIAEMACWIYQLDDFLAHVAVEDLLKS